MKIAQQPNQVIPESQKGQDWMKLNADAIKTMSFQDASSRRRDMECWYMYHNIYNESEFDYLTKISSGTEGENDYYLPAKIRHIPIQRSKLNVLISQQKHRQFEFSSSIANGEGRTEKFARMVHGFVGAVTQQIEQRVGEYNVRLSAIESQRSQIQQMLQQQPKSQEEAQQQQQMQQQMPVIENQLRIAKETLRREQVLSEQDFKKMSTFYQYEKADIVEDFSQKLALKLRQNLQMDRKSLKNFVSEVVTGKQQYYVDYNAETHELIYETLNAMNVYYPSIEGIEWIQDGPWVLVERRISINQAIDKYGLNDEDEISKLKDQINSSYSVTDFQSSEFGKNISGDLLYSGSNAFQEGVQEYQIFWRSCKKIQVKRSPNPYEAGKMFTHFLDDEEKFFHEGQLYWDNKKKKYIDRKSGSEYEKKDIILANKGEKLETRYIDEIYEATILGNDIYKNLRKKPIRLYSNENYSWTALPIFGKTFNSITDRPYSLVWDTKDIQKLYNLLHWHRELLLATSGVKGTIMDISQKPEGMSKKEWLYYKKLGTQWIETVKKHGRPMAYNQFGSYDDSMSSSVQYIDSMLMMLDDVMGNIIGVGRQRQGQVTGADQVATYQMAIQQNSLITEVIYAQHDEIERQAFEAVLNLATKYKFTDGGNFDYQTDDLSTETFKLPPQIFENVDLKINVANNTMNEQKLKELKQFAIKEYDKGILPFKDMIALYDTNTLGEMRKKFEIFTAEAFEVAQRNAENANNMEIEKEQKLMQAQAQVDSQIKQMDNQMKQMELQLKGQVEQLKIQTQHAKIQSDEKMHKEDNQMKIMEVQNENIIEQQYIDEQKRSNSTDERLRAIELQMKSLLGKADLQIKGAKGNSQHGMRSPEHISDR
jgi:hypothetical protein